MTAVLNSIDLLKDPFKMSSPQEDDDPLSWPSNTDWKQKYFQVAEMLSETRAELDDFQTSSKELEEELEAELERTEKAQQDLKDRVFKVEGERDDWKNKFLALQANHTSTINSLQRELDTSRQLLQSYKVQLRELEMGNDDLERNERAITSSLADIEARYARALEEKILLEHELQDKATMEEELQRLRDELRDLNSEVSVLKDQQARRNEEDKARRHSLVIDKTLPQIPSVLRSPPGPDEDSELLLNAAPPNDLLTTDLTITLPPTGAPELEFESERAPSVASAISATSATSSTTSGKSALLAHAGFTSHLQKSTSGLPRSSTAPNISPSRLPTPPAARRGAGTSSLRPTATAAPSRSGTVTSRASASSNASTGSSSRSKGVQMVSEMRARVKNLEMKIHTRVPRLRNPAIKSANPVLQEEREHDKRDSPWVFIKEATPIRRSTDDDDTLDSPTITSRRNGALSPPVPSSFRPLTTSTSGIPTPSLATSTGLPRRPGSRLSAFSNSTNGTGGTHSTSSSTSTQSSLASSRPSTPTFLPVPIFTATTPGGNHKDLLRRSSLGPPAPTHGPRAHASSGPMPPRLPIPRFSSSPEKNAGSKFVKSTSGRASATGRRSGDGIGLGVSINASALTKSRIGKERERPMSLGVPRRTAGNEKLDASTGRQRSESVGRP